MCATTVIATVNLGAEWRPPGDIPPPSRPDEVPDPPTEQPPPLPDEVPVPEPDELPAPESSSHSRRVEPSGARLVGS